MLPPQKNENEKHASLLKSFPPALQKLARPLSFERGALVFRQGEADPHIYLITQGLLKGVYTTHDGKEFIKTIIREGDFIGSMASQTAGGQCSFSLICLEAVQALRLPFAEVERRASKDLAFADLLRRAFQGLALKKEQREYELLCLSPEDRYRRLLDRSPDLLQRLTQNDIARYIGVTPVALSRIRARLRSNVT